MRFQLLPHRVIPRTFVPLMALALLSAPAAVRGQADTTTTQEAAVLNHKMPLLNGKSKGLNDYQGKVILVVNVASKCGLTPQYKQLQALHTKFHEQGLEVVGFPCNQFGGQEPGSPEEIREFCSTKYQVTFDLFDKVDVNGKNACALYKQLTSMELPPGGKGDISWNFEKFLIGRDGKPIARYSPRTRPDDEKLVKSIQWELAKPVPSSVQSPIPQIEP